MTQRVVNTLFYGLILLVVFSSSKAFAQVQKDDAIELYPSFRHRSVINTVLVSYYANDTFYLPMGELFGLLKINYEPYINGKILLRGKYLEEQTLYEIDLTSYRAEFGKETYLLDTDDFIIGELDYYLEIELFKEIFDLDFDMDINNLAVTLKSVRTLPVVSALLRAQKRERANYNRREDKNYDLRFDRSRSLFNGGFLDYNITNTYSNDQNLFSYNTSIGVELLGGDLQGNILGGFSSSYTSFETSNLRWRYMINDRPALSRVELGQTSMDGILNTPYTGIRITNDPVEPRRLFDEFQISGTTLPQSEVELYLNNSLIDFQSAGGLGNYNFLVPLTYGTSKYDIRIYGPTGRIIENSKNIQVPFTFTPPGVINYHLNAGQMSYRQIGSMNRDYLANADLSMGVTKWLSLDAGAEYFQSFDQPTYRGAVNTRLFSQYLFRGEYASDAYMKGSANVVYANATSFNVSYTEYTGGFSLYNLSNDQSQLLVNSYIPIRFFGIPLSFRANLFSRFRESVDNHRVRLEAALQKNRLNIRFAYLDNYSGKIEEFKPTNLARFQPSITYTIPRSDLVPDFIEGSFFRTQLTYFPQVGKVESAELFFAKGINERSRIQFVGNHNFIADVTSFGVNVVIDFNKIRTNASVRSLQSGTTVSQNIRGSFGYDPLTKAFLMTDREQVGRAATAVRLFVDNNGNSIYDDGDEPIDANAVRLDRAGSVSSTKNGVTYYTQLQPYYKYNLEVIKSNIPNPMLVPDMDKFALISDPNQYKRIDIPFFMSGVIEGRIEREIEGNRNAVGGLKLNLIKDDEIVQELRTFSEGSFYAYEIAPGTYKLQIPNDQLALLSSRSVPEYHEFEVKAVREGDFIEGLNFVLQPRIIEDSVEVDETIGISPVGEGVDAININYNIPVERLEPGDCRYGLQLGTYSTLQRARGLTDDSPVGTAYIVFNERNGLYALRSGRYEYLVEASNIVRDISSQVFPQISVISQCYAETVPEFIPGSFIYHIQFGAFSNPSSAETLKDRLNNSYNIDAFVIRDVDRRLTKVVTGRYPELRPAQVRLQELIRITGNQDLFVTKTAASLHNIDAYFDYRLELGEFISNDDAALYAARIDNNFGISSKILIDEQENITLVTDHDFASWSAFLEFKARLIPENGYITPVIQLLERKQ